MVSETSTVRGSALLGAYGLRKSFGGVVAVDDLSLELQAGSIVGLIGPNGAGKSSVINLISGLTRADGGTVRLGEVDVTQMSCRGRAGHGIARTFQVPRTFTELTVAEIVWLGALHGTSGRSLTQRRETVGRVVQDLGLEGVLDRAAATLSIGQLKRVELARALAMEPKALLLDEPMAGLRHGDVSALLELIKRLTHTYGLAVLIVEHVLSAITALCDHVVVMARGQFLLAGAPDEVIQHPAVIEHYLGKAYVARQRQRQGLEGV